MFYLKKISENEWEAYPVTVRDLFLVSLYLKKLLTKNQDANKMVDSLRKEEILFDCNLGD